MNYYKYYFNIFRISIIKILLILLVVPIVFLLSVVVSLICFKNPIECFLYIMKENNLSDLFKISDWVSDIKYWKRECEK